MLRLHSTSVICISVQSIDSSTLYYFLHFSHTLTFHELPFNNSRNIHFNNMSSDAAKDNTHSALRNSSISEATLKRTLQGVVSASEASENSAAVASDLLSSLDLSIEGERADCLLSDLLERIPHSSSGREQHDESLYLIKLTLAIAFMRHRSRNAPAVDSMTAQELELAWLVIQNALQSPLYANKRAVRSHQGFLSVPLCDLNNPDGTNEELWRVHLWLPNRPQPDERFFIHSHKSWAQSWILCGEGTDGQYEVEPVKRQDEATHAIFELADQKVITHRDRRAKIRNTERFVNVRRPNLRPHTRDMSYVVPAETFHTSQIPLSTAHATVFLFDATRGYSARGGVSLGPKDVPELDQDRDPGNISAKFVASVIEAVRSWEVSLEAGLSLSRSGRWSEARKTFHNMTITWKSTHEAMAAEETTSTTKEVQSLNMYPNAAHDLEAWVGHIESGRTEETKQFCAKMTDQSIAEQCQRILLERNS